jgi:hypothetical protein
MTTMNTARLDLESARSTFAVLECLELQAIAHNAGRMAADPKMQAWHRGEGREPSSRNLVSIYAAARARKLAGGGRHIVEVSEAREEDLIAALPAARAAVADLSARLKKVGATV